MIFKSRKINNQNNIGQILKDARYKTGLSLRMVAKHIKINKKYLAALENDDWEKMPGKIYAKNFFKTYCDFLNLNPDKLNLNFEQIPYFKNKNYTQNFTKKTHGFDFFNLPKLIKIILFTIIIIIVLIYLIWQINSILKPPEITLFHPLTDLTIQEDSITISGQTEENVELKINNQTIFPDENHLFFQTINLQPGLNTITIQGQKKYSQKQIIQRKIIVED